MVEVCGVRFCVVMCVYFFTYYIQSTKICMSVFLEIKFKGLFEGENLVLRLGLTWVYVRVRLRGVSDG